MNNPATGKPIATLPKMKGDETLTAIAAAHAVFPTWAAKTAKERGLVLRRWVRGLSAALPSWGAGCPQRRVPPSGLWRCQGLRTGHATRVVPSPGCRAPFRPGRQHSSGARMPAHPPTVLATLLLRGCSWFEEIEKAQDDIATIMTMECGKPLAESKAEIAAGWARAGGGPRLARRACQRA